MNISDFKVATDKKDGVWLPFEDAEFLVAYAHRPEFNRVTARISKKYPAYKLKADPSLYQQMTVEIIADCILLAWRNVNENGTPLACTPENKLKLLAIEPFREWISNESRELANFREEALAEDAGQAKSVSDLDAKVGRK